MIYRMIIYTLNLKIHLCEILLVHSPVVKARCSNLEHSSSSVLDDEGMYVPNILSHTTKKS